jgi:hypothetical protein
MRSGCRLWVVGCGMAFALCAAEPDWPQVEKHALEYFQQYVRIRSINPPADTAPAAQFVKAGLAARPISSCA